MSGHENSGERSYAGFFQIGERETDVDCLYGCCLLCFDLLHTGNLVHDGDHAHVLLGNLLKKSTMIRKLNLAEGDSFTWNGK